MILLVLIFLEHSGVSDTMSVTDKQKTVNFTLNDFNEIINTI